MDLFAMFAEIGKAAEKSCRFVAMLAGRTWKGAGAVINESMFSSKTDNWETPQDFFDKLNKEFYFNLDACATDENAKCKVYFTKEQDGLSQEWGSRTWCNPPYGREIGKWVKKASEESSKGKLVVMLVPARTDTQWFHSYIYNKCGVETRMIKGRLRFGSSKNSAPFPSMVVVFRTGI